MGSKKKSENQLNFLAPSLKEQLNPKHELYLLSHEVNWNYFENEFEKHYSDKGRPCTFNTIDDLFTDPKINVQSIR